MTTTVEAFEAALAEHGSVKAAARALGITEWRARKLNEELGGTKARGGEERPGVTLEGDRATVVSEAAPTIDLGDLEDLLRRRGLEPDDWEVERVTVNEWQAYAGRDDAGEPLIVTLAQLKAHLKRKVNLAWVFPAAEVAQRFVPTLGRRSRPSTRLVAILSDQQAPYFDEALHMAVLEWLGETQPDEIILAGDTGDFPSISRHADNPNWSATVQECLNATFRLLSDYRDAAPVARIRKLRGNHDWRLESELLTRAERMFGITPAQIPGEDEHHALSLRRLLHLDRLGIELVGAEGEHWKFGQVDLAPGLVVRHEAPKKDGRRVKASVVAGHTHRQSIVTSTEWEDGEPVFRTIVESGTLARIRGGLGYALDPDWQQGFATVSIVDGAFSYDLATWRDGRLTWRGEQWHASSSSSRSS